MYKKSVDIEVPYHVFLNLHKLSEITADKELKGIYY